MSQPTRVRRTSKADVTDPWQSWSSTSRYVIIQLAQALPTLAVIWQAFARH
jgi:hypothetical protein